MRCGMGCDYAVFVIPAAHFLFVGWGFYEQKVLKGISVLKSCSPKFSHVEAKCKQKINGTE